MLDGIRIIDFTQYLPGPFSTLRLADLGAEVIKIEALSGDPVRAMKINQSNSFFYANNRNKKSVGLNLKTEQGQELANDIIKQADVVMEGFRPGVIAKLGLGYEQVNEINKDIIYLSLSGFGQNSMLQRKSSHDMNYLAISGIFSQLKDKDGKPTQPTIQFADLISGIAASEAILAALVQRERTGKGTYIDLAMTDVLFSMMNSHVMVAHDSGLKQGAPVLDGSYANYRIYETKDKRFMTLGALEYNFWKNFCDLVGHPEWCNAYQKELSNEYPLYKEVEQLFLQHTQKEWTEIGEKHDCCLFPILEIDEAMSNNYILERQLIHYDNKKPYVHTHYGLEDIHAQSVPINIGAHTDEVLSDLLELSKTEIHILREDGIVK